MADTVDVKWIYPPNWDGNAPSDPKTGWRRVIVRLTGHSDGTGETDVVKVDISELRTSTGAVPTRTVIEWIEWQIFGLTVSLEWDRAPHKEIVRLNAHAVESHGRLDWSKAGGYADPSGAGDRTGDILLTTTNADSGDSYDITMSIRLKE